MVKLFGKSILEHQIEIFQKNKIKDITVVTGFKADLINFKGINYFHNEKYQSMAFIEKKVRSVIYKIFMYKFTGVTRDDMSANNQKALQAIEAMGILSEDYLAGLTRSEDAPNLPAKRAQTLKNIKSVKSENFIDDEIDKILKPEVAA